MGLENRASPKVSVVVTARNDNHGGNLLKRMQTFLDGLFEQARRHRLDCELIIVEWNPPSDKPRLAQALTWPRDIGSCSVRIIEVPASVHGRYRFSHQLPLFQMIAKNVGVRRARGRYILCSNIDLLFSDELMHFLASERLDPRRLYRVDRLDVPATIPQNASITKQLEYCRQNVIRINTRWGTFDPKRRSLRSLATALWNRAKDISRRTMRLGQKGVSALKSGRYRTVLLWVAEQCGRIWSLAINQKRRRWFKPLHTNACGDFTLLAREWWFRLRGYPEVEMFSFHLDSIFCHMAVLMGARELVLRRRLCAYHIEHGSGWSPEDNERLFNRIRGMGVPMLDLPAYYAWIDRMKSDRRHSISNDETWGLALEDLEEFDPVAPNVGPARVESLKAHESRI